MEIIKSKKEYDVIVVGSGAGGGMATKILSDAGVNVALVESGPYFDPANPEQMTQLKPYYQLQMLKLSNFSFHHYYKPCKLQNYFRNY